MTVNGVVCDVCGKLIPEADRLRRVRVEPRVYYRFGSHEWRVAWVAGDYHDGPCKEMAARNKSAELRRDKPGIEVRP